MDLSIIIPSYNEEKRIGLTLQRIVDVMKDKSYSFEVIVIDNGSIDDTAKVVSEFRNSIENLEIVQARSHGKGWAIKEGMTSSKGKYRLYTDADNSTDFAQFENLIDAVKDGYDIAIGSRKMKGSHIVNPQPARRRITSFIFSGLVKLIVPLGFHDTQNGFKLFTEGAAMKIFPQQIIYYWAFDVETLALAEVFKLKVKEVPIIWVDDADSKMTFHGMVRMLFEVIFIRINLWINKYVKNERRDLEAPERRRFVRDEEVERRSV